MRVEGRKRREGGGREKGELSRNRIWLYQEGGRAVMANECAIPRLVIDCIEALLVVFKARVGRGAKEGPQVGHRVLLLPTLLPYPRTAAQDGFSVRVVPAALVRVGEHGVGALDLFERLGGRLDVVLVLVRVPLREVCVCGAWGLERERRRDGRLSPRKPPSLALAQGIPTSFSSPCLTVSLTRSASVQPHPNLSPSLISIRIRDKQTPTPQLALATATLTLRASLR